MYPQGIQQNVDIKKNPHHEHEGEDELYRSNCLDDAAPVLCPATLHLWSLRMPPILSTWTARYHPETSLILNGTFQDSQNVGH